MRLRGRVLALALLSCSALNVAIRTPARADDLIFDIDPVHVAVRYTLGAFLHTVNGTFDLTCGAIRIDTATGKATGDVILDLRTGRSGEAARDSRMKTEILQTRQYPDAVLSVDHVDGPISAGGVAQLTLHGQLAIHGASHDVAIPLEIRTTDGQLTAHATLRVPYVAWGMRNPSTFILRVDDFVNVDVAGPFVETSSAAPAPHACPGTSLPLPVSR